MIDRLTVRMYRMGFGDCFLLTFHEGTAKRFVLIDCGSISEGAAQVSKVAKDVIAQVGPPNGSGRIELVVCTHRHRDHVGGFTDPGWAGVEVGEVWMPWTEDPDDAMATHIRTRQSSFAAALFGALAPAGQDETTYPLTRTTAGAKATLAAGVLAAAHNALTNESAMATLHKGFAGKPPRRFLPLKDKITEARTLAGLPGVTIHVLGPTRDEATIANMNPPKGEAYLRLRATADGAGPVVGEGAFRASWRIDEATFTASRTGTTFNAEDRKKIDDNAAQPDGQLAAAIDNAVNNTSLVLVFEVGDQWLLFPGDAQWGDWNGAMQEPKARQILERTTFYKVGHHGSHNATPRALLEEIIAGPFTAFLSTKQTAQWPNVPRQPLVDALTAKAQKMARTDDEAAAKAAGFEVSDGLCIEWETAIA